MSFHGVSCRSMLSASVLLLLAIHIPTPVRCASKPNMIVWMTDDISYKEYGFSGNKKINTPHLDRMAKQGVNFIRPWSNPICQPTRGMIMTGEYATRTTWWDQGKKKVNLGTEIGTFAHVAKDAGYRTLMVGKWQLKFPSAAEHGFDSYCLWDHSDILSDGDLRKKFVEEYGAEPFQKNARKGAGVPNRFWEPLIVRHLGDDKHKILQTPGDPLSFGPQIFLNCIRDFIRQSSEPFFVYFAGVTAHKHWDKVVKSQAWLGMPIVDDTFQIIGREPEGTGSLESNVEWTDTMAGRLRKIIEDSGVKDNTVLFFSSDNGSQKYGKGSTRSEFGVHVPLIAWGGPVVARNKPADRLVSLIDLYATIAEFSGGRQLAGHGSSEVRVRKHSYSLVPFLTKGGGVDLKRKYNVAYRGKKSIIVRSKNFILDGANVLWDCRGGKDEQSCEKTKKKRFSGKFKKLKKIKKQFKDDTLVAAK